MTEQPDSNRIHNLLKNFPQQKFVGMSGLALLCGATVFALSGDPNAALLGSVGSNVLAATLQQHFEKVRDLPTADENARLAQFAQSLAPEIRHNSELRQAVGAFLESYRTFDIAEALVQENPQLHGWLLTHIYSDVRAYRHDFERIHKNMAQLMARLDANRTAQAEEEAALFPYLKMVARRSEQLPLASLDPSGGEQTEVTLAVFVSLRVGTTIHLSEKEEAGETWLGVSDATLAHIHARERLILLGDAGSGKSTLLRHLVYCLAQARCKPDLNTLGKLSWDVQFVEKDKFETVAENAKELQALGRGLSRDKTPKPVKSVYDSLKEHKGRQNGR